MLRMFLFISIGCLSMSLSVASRVLPCHILDSVDISDGIQQPDGSLLFGGVMYPRDQYATVDYTMENGLKLYDDISHIRGCACHIKPCIRICCPIGTQMANMNGTCIPTIDTPTKVEIEILNGNNQLETMDLVNQHHFAYVYGFPCHKIMEEKKYYLLTDVMILGSPFFVFISFDLEFSVTLIIFHYQNMDLQSF